MLTVEQRIEWAELVGERRGIEQGMSELSAMMAWLSDAGREEDLKRSLSDPGLRDRLMEEYRAGKVQGA